MIFIIHYNSLHVFMLPLERNLSTAVIVFRFIGHRVKWK